MSSEQTHIENAIGDAVGHNVRPILVWLQGAVVAVIVGTVAVVGFVYRTDSALDRCMDILAQHEIELNAKSLEDKQRDKAISRMEGRLGLVSAKSLPEPKEVEEN